MKKTLAFFVAIFMIATFSTCVLAKVPSNPPDPFNFDNLLMDSGNIRVQQYGMYFNATTSNGFWRRARDNSSLNNTLSISTCYGIPLFVFDQPDDYIYIWLASLPSEKNKNLTCVISGDNDLWTPITSINMNRPIYWVEDNSVAGYTSDVFFMFDVESFSRMMLIINENNVVYPLILRTSDIDSGTKSCWEDYFPKNDQELTVLLQRSFHNKKQYTFYIKPNINSDSQNSGEDLDSGYLSKNSNTINPNKRPHYTISTTSTKGGAISTSGEELLLVGDTNQKYTIIADEGYTIDYIMVDGKIIQNSINCGDVATFTFDCIYGSRSIQAIFRKK